MERNITVEPPIHELYIELMCKQSPPSVCTYLKMAEGYRLEETLEVNGITDLFYFVLNETDNHYSLRYMLKLISSFHIGSVQFDFQQRQTTPHHSCLNFPCLHMCLSHG